MYEVIVLSSDIKKEFPFIRFNNWNEAATFIKSNLAQGWSVEINCCMENKHER